MAIGCAPRVPWSFNEGDFGSAENLPYDSPPQVIYRIDDHRFVTLEHYRDCNHGQSFYNDTRKGFHDKIGNGLFENYQGKIVNADPSGNNIVLPFADPPHVVCGDRGCATFVWYSTDGGETFHVLTYMPHSFNPYEDSKRYTIAVDSSRLYVSKARPVDSYVVSYPLIPGFVYSGKGLLPEGHEIEFDTTMPSGLRSPSGQDHITCDASIKPTNPDAEIIRERR
jgi:hypothetical protein